MGAPRVFVRHPPAIRYANVLLLCAEALNELGHTDEAHIPTLVEHDEEFEVLVDGKSDLLPIPQQEVNLNPSLGQNPQW